MGHFKTLPLPGAFRLLYGKIDYYILTKLFSILDNHKKVGIQRVKCKADQCQVTPHFVYFLSASHAIFHIQVQVKVESVVIESVNESKTFYTLQHISLYQ